MSEDQFQDQTSAWLFSRFMTNLFQRCGIVRGQRLLVGVSGGADSVALLHLLYSGSTNLDLDIEVAHLDHRLRPDSADDARFVSDLARKLGLPFHSETWDDPLPGEDAARRARYDFLQRIARQTRCDAIAIGHHLQDQIETVLFRLGRGTGIRGAMGMPWRRRDRVDIVRPLLDCRREMLIAYLETQGMSWRDDSTNADAELARNRIRQIALPALEQSLGPAWLEHWGEHLEDLRRIWNWLETSAAALLESARLAGMRSDQAPASAQLFETSASRTTAEPVAPSAEAHFHEVHRLETLRTAPEPVLRLALQQWLEAAGARDLTRKHLQAAHRLLENGQSGQELTLPGGVRLILEQGRVRLTGSSHTSQHLKTAKATTYKLELEPLTQATALDECLTRRPADDPTHLPHACEAILATDRLHPPFEVRTARIGERVQMLGAPGRRKVARLLQDRRIPRRLRPEWPVVADAEGIVWIPEIGVAERARVQAEGPNSLRMRLLRMPAPPESQPTSAPRNLAEPDDAA